MNEEGVFDLLIREQWPKLKRFFRTKVPESDVLDLVQNTMLAYVKSGGPVDPAKAREYLWGIARNQVLKHYERHRHGSQPFDSSVHTALDLVPSLSSQLDRRNGVVAALHTLTADEHTAVVLRHGEGLSLEEVAAALDVSLATAKRRLSAGESKLRAKLGSLNRFTEGYREL